MNDYRILAYDEEHKRYRPINSILYTGIILWATSKADTLHWYGLTRERLAVRRTKLQLKFPDIRFRIRRVKQVGG